MSNPSVPAGDDDDDSVVADLPKNAVRKTRLWLARPLLVVAILIAIDFSSNFSTVLLSRTLSSVSNKIVDDPWSWEAMLLRNVSSVFEFPEPMWPSSAQQQQQQQQSSCAYNFSFFVYEDLPRNLTIEFEDRLEATAANGSKIQENEATEWVLLQLFRTSPCRVYNASQAHLFFVPYMHHTHCDFAVGYQPGCGQVTDDEMNAVFASLQYYSGTTKHRHIFVNVYDAFMSKKQMAKNTYLKLTSGPISQGNDAPGSIVVPIFHDSPDYQPSILMKGQEPWWTRPRKYSFVAFFEAKLNPRMNRRQGRRFRVYFVNSVNKTYPDTVGGKPFLVTSLAGNGSGQPLIDYTDAYRESVFCPILPGDNCWQRRFFDVIRNGCLPVVLEWPLENGERSWHTPGGCSTLKTYPFIKGMFWNDSSIEIDYDSFVVRAPGNIVDETNVSSILTVMEKILADPQEVARRQRNMRAVAPLFTFGLGADAHVYDDAFSRIMKILQYRTNRLDTLAVSVETN